MTLYEETSEIERLVIERNWQSDDADSGGGWWFVVWYDSTTNYELPTTNKHPGGPCEPK